MTLEIFSLEKELRIRVATYNIHRCIGLDGAYAPQRIAQVLREMNCDICGLQEVDISLPARDELDQLSYLELETRMTAYHKANLYGSYGNALLSRYPILETREIDLSYRRFEPRSAIVAVIEVNHQPLQVINTHLGLKYWERVEQIRRILSEMSVDLPLVLLGDFNEWFPFSMNLRRLRRRLRGFRRSPASFPASWPKLSLDRVYVAPEPLSFRLQRVQNGLTRVASDHLPMCAEIEWETSQIREGLVTLA